MVNDAMSQITSVLSGIPQGSVLGPLLFICFVNDMPELVHSHIHMFADNTKVYHVINSTLDAQALHQDLASLEQWTTAWQLNFNAGKCKAMHLGPQIDRHKYHMWKEIQ